MLLYERTTGNLSRDGVRIGKCYSGRGAGLDNPQMEQIHDVGPVPAGMYTLQRCTAAEIAMMHKGPDVYRLLPADQTRMYGRSGFLIHWDNVHQDFTASEGCIVPLTSAVWQRLHDGDTLEVL